MKYYLVSENDLIDLLETNIWRRMLERDGVDNWTWYGESYRNIIKEYFPNKSKEELEDYSFNDCAEEDIKSYNFVEKEEE